MLMTQLGIPSIFPTWCSAPGKAVDRTALGRSWGLWCSAGARLPVLPAAGASSLLNPVLRDLVSGEAAVKQASHECPPAAA